MKLRDAKATLQATVNSLNEQLAKAEAKKKEEVHLIRGQLQSVETSHHTLMARKEAELERKTQQICDLQPFKQQVNQLKDEINTLRASANPTPAEVLDRFRETQFWRKRLENESHQRMLIYK